MKFNKNNFLIKNKYFFDKIQNALFNIEFLCKEIINIKDIIIKLILSEFQSKPLYIKLGFDPTSPDLHLGHVIILNKLHQFQYLGHKVILIIGDFTSSIGDPTGRNITRPLLKNKKIISNYKTYLKQINLIININNFKIYYNSNWYSKFNSNNFINLLSKYTLSRIIERKDFKKRLTKNISIFIHELIYPIFQGYDSVYLKSDIEIGGSDQKFNLLTGRELQKNFNLNPQCILTMPLLIGLDGKKKMSKSRNNHISINDIPNVMFSKVMSIPDKIMKNYYQLILFYSKKKIKKKLKNIKLGKDLKKIKLDLAYKIVTKFYSKYEANNSLIDFKNCSKGKFPKKINIINLYGSPLKICTILKKTKLCSSISESLSLIKQKGIRINGIIIKNKNLEIQSSNFILQKGKRKFIKIILK